MTRFSVLAFFSFLFASLAAAQPAPQPAPIQSSAPVEQAGKPDAKKSADPGHKITPEEAQQLFRSVDQILQFASRDTLLPVKHPVTKAMVSREQVEKYLADKFKDDADHIRFERSELVLKKFGLLPRPLNLHDFLIKLLSEQLAGYYDYKKKTINLLDWVAMDLQKPVMAHELTHALQDQSYDLEKMNKQHEEIVRRGPADYNALIAADEESTARTALMEGQAMIVFADYALNTMDDADCSSNPACQIPNRRSVSDFPQFIDLMLLQMDKQGGDALLDNAPLLLREALIFPYTQGMKFAARLLAAGGKPMAFTEAEKRMPRTSREILEPEEYLAGRSVPPLLLPDFKFMKDEFEPFDAGAVGQMDVSIMMKQFGQAEAARRLSREWRGGSYYAVARKGAKAEDGNSTARIGLIYVSRWSDNKSAQEFAEIYASALAQRYTNVEHLPAVGGSGWNRYTSTDGPIYIDESGPLVIAVESLDEATAQKVLRAVLDQQASAAKQAGMAP
jgi:hypothetical protein